MGNVKDFLYQELFATTSEAMELFSRSLGKAAKFDAFGGRTIFTAVVLTKPVVLEYADLTKPPAGGIQVAGAIGKFAFKARIIGDPSPHGYLPDPCLPALASKPQKQLNRIMLHTTFISADNYGDLNSSMPGVGDLVSVELKKNVFSYDMSYGTFLGVENSSTSGTTSDSELACASIDHSFGARGAMLSVLGSDVFAATGTTKSGALSFTTPELKIMYPHAMQILKFIAGKESGKYGFNAVNNGTKPRSKVKRSGTSMAAGLKPFVEMTVKEVRSYMSTHKCPDCGPKNLPGGPEGKWKGDKLFATGYYQVIPQTSKYYVKYLGESAYLTEENQHIVGMALALIKRPALGKYLLGASDNEVLALDQAAAEWASLPIYTPGGKSGACLKGQSYYCDDGTNAAHHHLGDVLVALRATKAAMAASTEVQNVLKANKAFQALK